MKQTIDRDTGKVNTHSAWKQTQLGDNKPFTAQSLSFPVFFWELGN